MHVNNRVGGPNLAPHGYLAVDFFFVLSGFVVASAYEGKLGTTMGFGNFVVRRLARLLPMSILGGLLGAAYMLLRWRVQPDASDPLADILGASALNLALLPKLWISPATLGELFPGNGVLWSLFMEVAINFIWAAALVRRSNAILIGITFAGLVALVGAGLTFGSIDLGWIRETFWGGCARVTFGFTAGVVIFRLKHRITWNGTSAPWIALIFVLLAILMPLRSLTWDILCVVIVLPLAVILGVATGSRRIFQIDEMLGRLSYPLYAIHLPLLMFAAGVTKKINPGLDLTWASVVLVPAIVLATYLVVRFYEEPVLAFLGARLKPQRGLKTSGPDRSAVIPKSQP
jgi:peptidoglycan/LPS O-acetylase OafA/YrhL